MLQMYALDLRVRKVLRAPQASRALQVSWVLRVLGVSRVLRGRLDSQALRAIRVRQGQRVLRVRTVPRAQCEEMLEPRASRVQRVQLDLLLTRVPRDPRRP